MGVEGETFLLTRYRFSLISLGTYALRLCLVCVVDVRVCPRSSVGILEGALDLTADLSKALFLHLCLFGFLLGQLAGLRTVHYQGADQRTSELLGNEKTKGPSTNVKLRHRRGGREAKQATRWLSWYGVGLASADRLPVVVRIPAGPLGSLKCDPPKGNGRRPQKGGREAKQNKRG